MNTEKKNNICIAVLAHVDSGKTTLSEALLYKSGKLRSLGRVDHKDAFLDNDLIERSRGITIFSKQAVFDLGKFHVNLLDTPGHMDFSAEMERTLSVIDYAILIISGPDGVQAHTQTLWELLRKYHVPTVVWINKMDLTDRDVIAELKLHFGEGFVDFNTIDFEKIAELDEPALDQFLETGSVEDSIISALISSRKLFPCYSGSALKLTGVDHFLSSLPRYLKTPCYGDEFGARVYKITHAEDGQRLSWIRLTGGSLHPRDVIGGEKLNQIRAYSGAKYTVCEEGEPGNVYALTGLNDTYAGQGLGSEHSDSMPLLQPVLMYRIIPPEGVDAITAMKKLSLLAEEDPMLRIVWDSRLKEIQAQLMGEVQIDVLKEIISDRYGMDVDIDTGQIVYKETIAEPVIGMGHFEPLRHYAEVHLLMEPLPAGSGLEFVSACAADSLDINWQRLVLTNLAEREHLGVLTGSPITDMRISLVAGRAHLKHTEGGDFRQAVYRAVRHGLMSAKSVLLEPYYDFSMTLPSEYIGRAISDCKAMSCSFDAPKTLGDAIRIDGRGPVFELRNYLNTLLSYTKGHAHLNCNFAGYYPCHNADKVVEDIAYDPERDVENTADSVFCSHGSGVNVKWNKVSEFVHIDSGIRISDENARSVHAPRLRSGNLDLDDKELREIMQREFGETKRPQPTPVTYDFGVRKKKEKTIKKDYLIVDGYNMIFAWDELKELAKDSVAAARTKLIDMLANYKSYKGNELCLIFDGYRVKDNRGTKQDDHGIHVVYTKEGESADAYIEALIGEIGHNYSVRVATSDALIQLSALRSGVIRMSSRELKNEIDLVFRDIRDILKLNSLDSLSFADIAKINKKE